MTPVVTGHGGLAGCPHTSAERTKKKKECKISFSKCLQFSHSPRAHRQGSRGNDNGDKLPGRQARRNSNRRYRRPATRKRYFPFQLPLTVGDRPRHDILTMRWWREQHGKKTRESMGIFLETWHVYWVRNRPHLTYNPWRWNWCM